MMKVDMHYGTMDLWDILVSAKQQQNNKGMIRNAGIRLMRSTCYHQSYDDMSHDVPSCVRASRVFIYSSIRVSDDPLAFIFYSHYSYRPRAAHLFGIISFLISKQVQQNGSR